MPTKLKPEEQMTNEEFLAYTGVRPDGERWELIEGIAVMNASPTDVHQMIAANIVGWLRLEKQRTMADWMALLGIGTRVPVSPRSLPLPDVFVKAGRLVGTSVTADALALFGILSKSNTGADQAWRRRVYASIPNCQHYVVVSQADVSATRYDRTAAWGATTVTGLDGVLRLPALGGDVAIPLAEAYRWTPLDDRA